MYCKRPIDLQQVLTSVIFVDEKMEIDSNMSLAGENANMQKEKNPEIAEKRLMTSVARSTSYNIVLQVRIFLYFHPSLLFTYHSIFCIFNILSYETWYINFICLYYCT